AVGLARLAKNSLDTADAIGKAAERTGFQVEKLQELRYAADQTGVSTNELDNALAKFTKRLGLARDGSGAAARAYKRLGVNLNQANSGVFREVVDRLSSMDNHTNRLALTTELFGENAQKLELTLRGGNQQLEEWGDKAQRLGLILDEDLVRGAESANDELSTMKQVMDAQFTRAFVELAPVITELGQAFADSAPKVAIFFNQFKDVGNQSLAAAEDTARKLQESYEVVFQRLEKRKALESNRQSRSLGDLASGLFGQSSEDLETQLKEIEAKFKAAVERVKELRQESANQFATQTEKDKGITDGLAASVNTVIPKVKGLSDAQKEFNRQLKESQSIYDSTRTPLEKYNQQLKELNNLRSNLKGTSGEIGDDAYLRKIDKMQKDLMQSSGLQSVVDKVDINAPLVRQLETLQQLKEAFPEYTDIIMEEEMNIHEKMDGMTEDLVENAETAKEAWEDLGLTFASAFEDAIVNGEDLSSVLKGLEQDIIRMITRNLITKDLGNAIGGMFSGGGVGSWLGGLFGGFRAEGGPVTAGKSYIVGEKRAELFTPTQNGHISPSAGGGVNVVMNISTPDANSFRRSEGQLGAQAAMAINNAGRYL
ncbi:MAG: hypothetical protein GY755_02105, partial [Chloroflexi bacterium]|nr:hypothetical protein [Chloroflexota bacterium]